MSAIADGRKLRSVRTRDAVIDALLTLYDEGHVRPGAALISERAGVSQSSVFRLFQDLEGLVETAVERQWDRLLPALAPPDATGDLAARVDALVAQRLRLHDAAGTAMRAARVVVPDSPAVVAAFTARRRLLREQIEAQFAPELDRLDGHERRTLLDALDAACGLEPIDHLRTDLGYSARRTAATVAATLTALARASATRSST